jgi:hypothetical protein
MKKLKIFLSSNLIFILVFRKDKDNEADGFWYLKRNSKYAFIKAQINS